MADDSLTPFVTHRELGTVHRQIGALEQGQANIIATYNHLRGDMLSGFDRLEKVLRESAAAQSAQVQSDAKRAAQDSAQQGGFTLTLRELALGICAIMMASIMVTYSVLKSGFRPETVETIAKAAE